MAGSEEASSDGEASREVDLLMEVSWGQRRHLAAFPCSLPPPVLVQMLRAQAAGWSILSTPGLSHSCLQSLAAEHGHARGLALEHFTSSVANSGSFHPPSSVLITQLGLPAGRVGSSLVTTC